MRGQRLFYTGCFSKLLMRRQQLFSYPDYLLSGFSSVRLHPDSAPQHLPVQPQPQYDGFIISRWQEGPETLQERLSHSTRRCLRPPSVYPCVPMLPGTGWGPCGGTWGRATAAPTAAPFPGLFPLPGSPDRLLPCLFLLRALSATLNLISCSSGQERCPAKGSPGRAGGERAGGVLGGLRGFKQDPRGHSPRFTEFLGFHPVMEGLGTWEANQGYGVLTQPRPPLQSPRNPHVCEGPQPARPPRVTVSLTLLPAPEQDLPPVKARVILAPSTGAETSPLVSLPQGAPVGLGALRAVGSLGMPRAVGCLGTSRAVGCSEMPRAVGCLGTSRAVGCLGTSRTVGCPEMCRAVGYVGTLRAVGCSGTLRVVGYSGMPRAAGCLGSSRVVGCSWMPRAVGCSGTSRAVGCPEVPRAVRCLGTSRAVGCSGRRDAWGHQGPWDARGH